jgi:hypothetical protein
LLYLIEQVWEKYGVDSVPDFVIDLWGLGFDNGEGRGFLILVFRGEVRI